MFERSSHPSWKKGCCYASLDRRGELTMPPICRYSSDAPPSPARLQFSFPVMACTVATTSISSRRFGAAALIIAAVISLVLVIDPAAGAELRSLIITQEHGAAVDPFAAFITEASQQFGVPASWILRGDAR
jgi:hypothetical protein